MLDITLQTLRSISAIDSSPTTFDGVHLWWVMNTDFISEKNKIISLLTPEEQDAAARFVTTELSWRYQVARGILRALLSHYLQCPALEIELPRADKGKPYLLDTALQFNLSHAQDGVLYGFSWDHPLGVDVEYTSRTHMDMLAIAKRYFHPNEYNALEKVAPQDQGAAFYRIWTQKEAVLKATGDGIAHHLSICEVNADPTKPPQLLSFEGIAVNRWHIHSFEPATGYLAAIAFEK